MSFEELEPDFDEPKASSEDEADNNDDSADEGGSDDDNEEDVQKHSSSSSKGQAASIGDKRKKDSSSNSGSEKPAQKTEEQIAKAKLKREKLKQKKRAKLAGADKLVQKVEAQTSLIAQGAKKAAKILWTEFVALSKDKYSTVEMDEIRIDESHVVQPEFSQFGDFNAIGDFMAKAMKTSDFDIPKNWQKGSSRVLIIVSSAMRGCDLLRGLATIRGKSQIGKFFAKHMKFEQQTKFIQKIPFTISMGTPNRLLKLMSDGGLSLDQTELCILDYTHLDAKKRNLFQTNDIQDDLLKLLRETILPRCIEGHMKLSLF
eukprot:m.25597 g.25597  ORF g.25597 m.25597 type:complete len:316 (+) comp9786_c0_seq1:2940-3887(+)